MICEGECRKELGPGAAYASPLGVGICREDLLRMRRTTPTFGRFVPFRLLKKGGQGAVYLAERLAPDPRENELVAVKVLPLATGSTAALEAMHGLFRREIQLHAGLERCPYVVRVVDYGCEEGRALFLALELVTGSNLAEHCPLPVGEACRLAEHILLALQFVHERGLVHRDVKPENVLLAERTAKLADFGLAKEFDRVGLTTGDISITGAFAGTPQFAAPDQYRDYKRALPPADIYSFGATFYFMLTGREIFELKDATLGQWRRHHQLEAPVPLRSRRPDVPAALEAFVLRCLEKDAARRFASAQEAVLALRAIAPPPELSPEKPLGASSLAQSETVVTPPTSRNDSSG